MIGGDRLAKNAFRVLGLSADASASDVHKAAATARRAFSLGLDQVSEADLPELGPCLRNESTIRTALGQLANPADRLTHRLLWFHAPRSNSVEQAFSLKKHHDDCLARLVELTAMDAARFEPNDWTTALLNWHLLLSRDDYWEVTTALELCGSFEPPACSSEVDKLRHAAVAIAAEPFVALAREAVHRDDLIVLGKSLSALEQLEDTGDWSRAAQSELGQPILEKFEALCSGLQSDLGGKIVRESAAAASNKTLCDAAYKRYQAEVSPELESLRRAFKDAPRLADACREAAAQCLGTLGMGYTWADQYVTAEELYSKALALAHDTLAASALQQGLENVNVSANHQRTRGAPIEAAPSLSTVNGIGFRLYGQSDVDPETGSYSSNHYFTVLHFPIFPVGRYRVISSGANGYHFLGKLPFRNLEKLHLGIALAAIVLLSVGIYFSNQQSATSSYSAASSPLAADSASPTSSTATSATTDVAPVAADGTDRDAVKARIDAGRARIAELESALSPTVARMKSLEEQMTGIKGEIDSLDASKAAGTSIDLDHYNSLVDSFNALLTERRGLADTAKPQLDEYNTLLEQDKTMVAQYNAMGR
jgi:tetratricopeptide (TPR) repeat protein